MDKKVQSSQQRYSRKKGQAETILGANWIGVMLLVAGLLMEIGWLAACGAVICAIATFVGYMLTKQAEKIRNDAYDEMHTTFEKLKNDISQHINQIVEKVTGQDDSVLTTEFLYDLYRDVEKAHSTVVPYGDAGFASLTSDLMSYLREHMKLQQAHVQEILFKCTLIKFYVVIEASSAIVKNQVF